MRAIAIACLMIAACGNDAAHNEAGRILERALRRSIAASDVVTAFDPARIETREELSGAIPGLRYLLGTYTPPNVSPHGVAGAIVAVRAERAVLLESASDWVRAVGEWHPPDSAAAIIACAEAARFAPGRPHPQRMPILYTGPNDLLRPFVFRDDSIAGSEMTGPVAHGEVGSNYEVELWMIEVERARKYTCYIGKLPGTFSIRAVADDPSVGLLGLSS